MSGYDEASRVFVAVLVLEVSLKCERIGQQARWAWCVPSETHRAPVDASPWTGNTGGLSADGAPVGESRRRGSAGSVFMETVGQLGKFEGAVATSSGTALAGWVAWRRRSPD